MQFCDLFCHLRCWDGSPPPPTSEFPELIGWYYSSAALHLLFFFEDYPLTVTESNSLCERDKQNIYCLELTYLNRWITRGCVQPIDSLCSCNFCTTSGHLIGNSVPLMQARVFFSFLSATPTQCNPYQKCHPISPSLIWIYLLRLVLSLVWTQHTFSLYTSLHTSLPLLELFTFAHLATIATAACWTNFAHLLP